MKLASTMQLVEAVKRAFDDEADYSDHWTAVVWCALCVARQAVVAAVYKRRPVQDGITALSEAYDNAKLKEEKKP